MSEISAKIKSLTSECCKRNVIEVLKMQEINDNTFLEKQQEDMICEQEDQVEDISMKDKIQVIKKVKEIKKDKEIDEKIVTFLHEKGLSENLVKTLINTGFTDEHVRLLKALNLIDNEIDNLQDLWRAKIEVSKSNDSINSTTSDSSSSDGCAQLSPNSIYLKKVLSEFLIPGLCEIVAKKPIDPVEYLGHLLLHYKICEERAMQQREREVEILNTREKLKLKQVEDKEGLFIQRKDKDEEHGEDQNYLDYGEL